jgi:effector-binding domain-containing protein
MPVLTYSRQSKEVLMYQVSSRVVTEQPALVMCGKVAAKDISDFLGKAYAAVEEQTTRLGVVCVGPPFARYRPLDDEFSEFEIEAGFPVNRLIGAGSGPVESSTLPGGPVAAVTHIGPYDQMMPAYQAIEAWVTEHNGVIDGPPWEVYYTDPSVQPDPSTWRTEIIQPYKTV